MLVEEIEHGLEVRPDDVAMGSTRHFDVLMFDTQFPESRGHITRSIHSNGRIRVAMNDELGRTRDGRNRFRRSAPGKRT